MNKKLIIAGLILTGIACSADSCGNDDSTRIEHEQQEQASLQAVKTVGMPAITLFAEKEMMKTILETRDHMLPTYTYLHNAMQGTIGQKICNSIGYGLSGATQYTNPSKVDRYISSQPVVIPQADPNGLYSPAETHGTWVLCHNDTTNKNEAQYIEPDIIVLTFPKEQIKQ
jgi:hypothetical protein